MLMVDSGSAEMTDQVLSAIRAVQQWVEAKTAASAPPVLYGAETRNSIIEARSADVPPKPIRYIVATSIAPDHIGGNVKVSKRGADVHRRQCRRAAERRRPGCGHPRAREPAEPDVESAGWPAAVPNARVADGYVSHRLDEAE